MVRSEQIIVWDDTQIVPGSNWKSEIETALDQAQIAVLLVTSNFLASDFIATEEMPKILKKASSQGLTIVWVAVSHCLYTETELANYQAANNPQKPLDSLPEHEQNQVIVDICRKIKNVLNPEPGPEPRERFGTNEPEIAPDNWDDDPNSFFGKIKKLF